MLTKKKKYVKNVYLSSGPNISNPTPSFASGINFYKLLWIFVIGATIGFVVETIYCVATLGHFENRSGLIFGPFKPIYGFGSVLFTLLLYKIRHLNGIFIFFLSGIIGAGFEIICSLFEEYVFGVAYWEYSDSPMNIDGRTNLFYAICWAFLGLVFIRHMYPFISKIIEKIPNKIGPTLTWIMTIFLIIDIALSGFAIWRCVDRTHGIEAKNSFEIFLDKHYTNEFLEELYPTMTIL